MKLRRKSSQDKAPKSAGRREESRQVPQIRRPEAYRYHAARSDSLRSAERGSDRQKPKSLRSKLDMIGTLLFAGVLSVSFISALLLTSSPAVRFSDESKQQLVDTTAVEDTINQLFKEEWTARTKLTINTSLLSSKIQDALPEVSSANITFPLVGRTPIVHLQFKEPLFVLEASTGSFLVDAEGVATSSIQELPQEKLTGLSELPRVQDASDLEVTRGMQVVSEQTVEFVQVITDQYEQKQRKISKMVLPSTSINEMHITAQNQPFYVKYLPSESARQQFGAYQVTVDHLGAKASSINYIDVRVPGKVFYK